MNDFADREECSEQADPKEDHFQHMFEFFMLKVSDYSTQVDLNQKMGNCLQVKFELGLKQWYQDSDSIFLWLSQLCIIASLGCICSWKQNDNSSSRLVSVPTMVQGKCCKSLGIHTCSLDLIGLCTYLWICHCSCWKGDMASTNLELSLKLEVGQSHLSHVENNGRGSSSLKGCQNIASWKGGIDDGKAINSILCKGLERDFMCGLLIQLEDLSF